MTDRSLETRALFALWRNHPDTPTSDRWGERAHRRARLGRNMLLAWAATLYDDQLLDFRNFGAKSLVWVRANQTSSPAAPLDVERLDVERLARALYVIWPNDNQWDAQPVWFREKAEAIAREYAALEEPTDD